MPKRHLNEDIDPSLDLKPATLPISPPPSPSPSPSTTETSTPKKKPRRTNLKSVTQSSPISGKPQKEKAGTKTAWNAEEDQILLGIMDQLIKSHLWPLIKADGRLVHRTSYGAQYHARMLLAKGTGGKAK